MKQFFTILAAIFLCTSTFAQVGINTNDADGSSALDITSTTKGFLMPRMTDTQRQNISSPAQGLQVFVEDFEGGTFMFYDGSQWMKFSQVIKKPDAPTIGTATNGNGQVRIAFTAPLNNGSAITSYTATSNPGGITGVLSQAGSGIITVTGLTNGTAYTFTVTATNSVGTSSASSASNSVTAASAPSAPTIGTATSGIGQATIAFTAPSSSNGSSINYYTVTSSGGHTQTGSNPITITNLTNGTAYTFTVTATNSVGTSSASSASNSVTPAGAPSAPTIGTATSGNGQVTIAFTAPSYSGSVITSYTATSSPGGITGTLNQAGSGTITVTGLTNSEAYTFTVTATNGIGTSSASSASNTVTAASAPDAPTIGTATAGSGQATIAFTATSNSNGSAVTNYTVISSPGDITVAAGSYADGDNATVIVTGLTNATAYTFTVTATNSVGTSSASSASNSVTPAIAPDAPEDVTATSGNGQVTIEFSTPSNNGSAITYYTATSSPGGQTAVLSQAESGTITVTGLTNGTAYTFTVTADNYFGTSSASSASNSVTAASAPTSPSIEGERATGYNGQAAIAFTAPSNNGSAITSYTATSNPGGITGTLNQAGSGTITVDGLTNDTAYTFKVTATNGVGTSLVSSASNSVTPFGVGKFLHGGVVFYIFKSGDNGYVSGETHGLVAAVSDQTIEGTGIRWQPTDFDTDIGTTEAVGTGSANTDAIIAAQGGTETSYAAGLARAYTGGSYTDWFLPSKDELNHIFLIKSTINTTAVANGGSNLIISEEGYNTQYYWSSTEFNAYKARSLYMPHSGNPEDGGWQYIHDKGIWNPVRAVRAF